MYHLILQCNFCLQKYATTSDPSHRGGFGVPSNWGGQSGPKRTKSKQYKRASEKMADTADRKSLSQGDFQMAIIRGLLPTVQQYLTEGIYTFVHS